MAEYTKIETARAIICDFCNQLYSDEPCEPADCDWLRMLEEDAADVAPVVRCKDCLFWESGENECESWEWCKTLHHDMPSHAFCNFGVRKDDLPDDA